MKKKKTLDGIRFNEPAAFFAIRHMTANSNDNSTEQQQQRQQHSVCISTCQACNTSYKITVPGI